MRRCPHCQSSARRAERLLEASREVSGHRFVATLPAVECAACGHAQFDVEAERRFALAVARQIADSGLATGEAFRFMRKAIGMRATEFAELLDLAPETISRWETEKRAVDRGALALMGNLVRDVLEGRTTTLDGLRSLRAPRDLGTTVPVAMTAPACAA
jgi:putative zinc finger/helix-turn-helix YgiT family protein